MEVLEKFSGLDYLYLEGYETEGALVKTIREIPWEQFRRHGENIVMIKLLEF